MPEQILAPQITDDVLAVRDNLTNSIQNCKLSNKADLLELAKRMWNKDEMNKLNDFINGKIKEAFTITFFASIERGKDFQKALSQISGVKVHEPTIDYVLTRAYGPWFKQQEKEVSAQYLTVEPIHEEKVKKTTLVEKTIEQGIIDETNKRIEKLKKDLKYDGMSAEKKNYTDSEIGKLKSNENYKKGIEDLIKIRDKIKKTSPIEEETIRDLEWEESKILKKLKEMEKGIREIKKVPEEILAQRMAVIPEKKEPAPAPKTILNDEKATEVAGWLKNNLRKGQMYMILDKLGIKEYYGLTEKELYSKQTAQAIALFQEKYNEKAKAEGKEELVVDGKPGSKTRKALDIDEETFKKFEKAS